MQIIKNADRFEMTTLVIPSGIEYKIRNLPLYILGTKKVDYTQDTSNLEFVMPFWYGRIKLCTYFGIPDVH